MNDEAKNLDLLRKQIDEIDDKIHDLLMQRTEIVHGVARVKNAARELAEGELLVPSLAMRPEREAQIMRRLKQRHRGELPFHVIAQLWRELINAKTRLQGPLEIALCAGHDVDRPYDWRDLARAYYGAATTLEIYSSAHEALEAVVTRPGVIGILPTQEGGDEDRWWPYLLTLDGMNDLGGPRIVSRLPILANDPEAPDYPAAFTIGCMDPASSGDDTSVFVATSAKGADANDIIAQIGLIGLGLEVVDRAPRSDDPSQDLILLKSKVYVPVDQVQFDRVLETDGPVVALRSVGAYSNPISCT